MSSIIIKNVILVTTSCAVCGMPFAVPDYWNLERRQRGDTFYCPNGHSLVYDSENEKLRKQIARLAARNTHLEDQRKAAERSAAAFKGQVTKIRNRVGNGVCPCCNRSFQNLRRHMTAKHPDFREDT